MNFLISSRRVLYQILLRLPYKILREFYLFWTKTTPEGLSTSRGERWSTHSWEELVGSGESTNLLNAYRYYWLVPKVIGKRVLDLGCGVGYGSYLMSFFAKSVVGIDYSPDAIAWAEKYFKRQNTKFIVKNVFDLDFFQQFDVIVCIDVLEHVEKQNTLLKKIHKICKEKLYITVPNSEVTSIRIRHLKRVSCFGLCSFHIHEPSLRELENLLRKRFPKVTIYGLHPKNVQTPEDWVQFNRKIVSLDDFEMIHGTNFDTSIIILAECEV